MQRCLRPIIPLFVTAIMCFSAVQHGEARHVRHQLQDDSNVNAETFIQDTPTLSTRRHTRGSGLPNAVFGEPDKDQLAIERQAVETVRQLEMLQGATGSDASVNKVSVSGENSLGGELGDLLSKASGTRKRLETNDHEIKRIVSGLEIGDSDDDDDDESEIDDDDEDDETESKAPDDAAVRVELQLAEGAVRRRRKRAGGLDADSGLRSRTGLGPEGAVGSRTTSRSSRKKRKVVKIVDKNRYTEESADDDDDDDEEEEEIEDDEDEDEIGADVEVVEYEEVLKKKPKTQIVAVPYKPRRRHKHHHYQKPVLQLPPDVIEAMHQMQMAKQRPKKHKQKIQIIEVMKKEPATPAPAMPAAPAAAPAAPPPSPQKINVA